MKSKKFSFIFGKEKFTIVRSDHLYQKRGDSSFSRDEFIDNSRYIDIMKCAMRNSLTSFREKGAIVVTVPDFQNVYYSILVEMRKNNEIFIITVFRTRLNWWKTFVTCTNRINILHQYVIPRMSESEREDKKRDRFFHEAEGMSRKEDNVFKALMEYCA